MKIWGNDLKLGDTVYYTTDYTILKGEIVEKDTKTFKLPSLITNLGHRLFVNEYYYTEKDDVLKYIIKDLKMRCKKDIYDAESNIKLLTSNKKHLEQCLENLNNYEKELVI